MARQLSASCCQAVSLPPCQRPRRMVPLYSTYRLHGVNLTLAGRAGNAVCWKLGPEREDKASQGGRLYARSARPLWIRSAPLALTVQDELSSRAQEVERLRRQQVECARYEAELGPAPPPARLGRGDRRAASVACRASPRARAQRQSRAARSATAVRAATPGMATHRRRSEPRAGGCPPACMTSDPDEPPRRSRYLT